MINEQASNTCQGSNVIQQYKAGIADLFGKLIGKYHVKPINVLRMNTAANLSKQICHSEPL